LWPGIWERLLAPVYPDLETYIYQRASMGRLLLEHVILVGISSGFAVAVGMGLGVFVTRPVGRPFLASVNSLVSMGQTFPPVAVLALAVPAVGFGAKPTVIALFLYGLLPVVRNTVAGLEAVPPAVKDAGLGMGMSWAQMLRRVELPLSLPVVMAGIRTSVVINIGTATIGATIGAGGLGAPIITGISSDNPAFILQGAVAVALLAIATDMAIGMLEISKNGKDS